MPVSGSKVPAEQGKLVGMMAGDRNVVERIRPPSGSFDHSGRLLRPHRKRPRDEVRHQPLHVRHNRRVLRVDEPRTRAGPRSRGVRSRHQRGPLGIALLKRQSAQNNQRGLVTSGVRQGWRQQHHVHTVCGGLGWRLVPNHTIVPFIVPASPRIWARG